jgi:hypothetical protein
MATQASGLQSSPGADEGYFPAEPQAVLSGDFRDSGARESARDAARNTSYSGRSPFSPLTEGLSLAVFCFAG